MFDFRMTARAIATAAICELESAIAAYELVFLFGGHHGTTFAAMNDSGKGEGEVRLRAGISLAAQENLDPIILGLRHHWFVNSLVPLAAAVWELIASVVKGSCENAIYAAMG